MCFIFLTVATAVCKYEFHNLPPLLNLVTFCETKSKSGDPISVLFACKNFTKKTMKGGESYDFDLISQKVTNYEIRVC